MNYIRNIKLPVVKLFIYPTIGFIAYCAYQDMIYKSKQDKTLSFNDPISLLQRSHEKWLICSNIEELISIYKFTYNHLSRYMTYNSKKKNLVKNFKADKNGSFVTFETDIYSNHYLRQTQKISGNFNLGLWTNWQKQNKLKAQPAEKQQKIIIQQLKKRRSKCYDIAFKSNQIGSYQNNQAQYFNCIRETQSIAAFIKKQFQSYQNMKKQWN